MLWVAKLQPLVSVVWEKYASAVAHRYTKLRVRNPDCFAQMIAEQSGGMPTRNWSSIAVIDKSSAAIAVSPLASNKNSTRKYCSHNCYIADRFHGGDLQ